ncbi:polyhydroxybutyrate depolymerase [Nocardia sp. GAS34]|uniref:alpha/beta hydrolase family esterase n=1 Tax=unclassified Nocardia TaxID=2637762 RepID=UPI003D1E6CE1
MAEDLKTGELTVDGRARTFSVRPPRHSGAPLIVALHGNMSGMPQRPPVAGPLMDSWMRFSEFADAYGVAVVYPDGHEGCWADGRGVTVADADGVDDIAFLRALIDWCAAQYGTEREQTVAAGISNGAFMAHLVGHELSELVPVVAAVAGGLPVALRGHEPTHAVSALLINGTADEAVPITGGFSRHRGPDGELRGQTLGLAETAAHWRSIDRCAGEGTTITTEGSSRHTVEGGVGGARVADWTVFGGGHTWPGKPTPPEWEDGPNTHTSTDFDAAQEILRFAQPLLSPAAARKL